MKSNYYRSGRRYSKRRSGKRRKLLFLRRILLICFQAAWIAILIYGLKGLFGSKDISKPVHGMDTAAADHTAPHPDTAEQTPAGSPLSPISVVRDPGTGYPIDLLLLVNASHSLPDDYNISITNLENGQAIATICYEDLCEMMEDCRSAGLSPLICSSYRSMEKQQDLFADRIRRFMNEGYDETTAREKAATVVAIPGTSEHQLGLALDIVDSSNQLLEDCQEDTPCQQWLLANSYKYGFILRYPKERFSDTGIIYEPWHYRYVGRETALYMHERNLCLEDVVSADYAR